MHSLYHGTDAEFTEFSLDFAARPNMASNGFLGIWFATDREHAARFGKYCLTVAADIQQPKTISISQLAQWHRDCANQAPPDIDEALARQVSQRFYTDIRETLLSQGHDAILVEELSGNIDIVIVLQPERARIVSR